MTRSFDGANALEAGGARAEVILKERDQRRRRNSKTIIPQRNPAGPLKWDHIWIQQLHMGLASMKMKPAELKQIDI